MQLQHCTVIFKQINVQLPLEVIITLFCLAKIIKYSTPQMRTGSLQAAVAETIVSS